MFIRLTGIGIIILAVAWTCSTAATAAVAGQVTPAPADVVITDDIVPYTGPLGPDSPLYGLKLALENLDEAFTGDTSRKVAKEMEHAELRIAEAKGLLSMNRTGEAGEALEAYFEKMNLTELDISTLPARTTGIANAYEQHVRHELALQNLLRNHPGDPQLRQAYQRSLGLEEKFIEKSGTRLEKVATGLNRITVRVVQSTERAGAEATREQPKEKESGAGATPTVTPDHGKGQEKQEEKGGEATSRAPETITPSPRDDSGKGAGNGKEAGKGGETTPPTGVTTTPLPDDTSGKGKGKEKNEKGS